MTCIAVNIGRRPPYLVAGHQTRPYLACSYEGHFAAGPHCLSMITYITHG